MIDKAKYLVKTQDGSWRLVAYVKDGEAQAVAEALHAMMQPDPTRSKSSVIVEAILAHAAELAGVLNNGGGLPK